MMGGHIWIESELGKGATFAFTVQLKKSIRKRVLPTIDIDWQSIRILAVDDDPDAAAFICEHIHAYGANCDVAASGEEALRLVEQKGAYDVCFIAWKLPDINSLELVERLKEKENDKKNIPVLMFSAFDLKTIESDVNKPKIDKFLSKPLFPSDICDCIIELLCNSPFPSAEDVDSTDFCFDGARILLAEDVEINREIVRALLEPTLVEIDCAENGTQAVLMYTEAPDKYDMIFMDLQMPEKDGFEATRQIRESGLPGATSIPIVAMTANVFKEDVEKCLEAGMDAHIGKPLDYDEVLHVMQTYLTKANKRIKN